MIIKKQFLESFSWFIDCIDKVQKTNNLLKSRRPKTRTCRYCFLTKKTLYSKNEISLLCGIQNWTKTKTMIVVLLIIFLKWRGLISVIWKNHFSDIPFFENYFLLIFLKSFEPPKNPNLLLKQLEFVEIYWQKYGWFVYY